MVKTKVEAGICGFITEIQTFSEDNQNVKFEVNTNCENIKKLSEKLPIVDAYNEIKEGFDGELYKNNQTGIERLLFRMCCASSPF